MEVAQHGDEQRFHARNQKRRAAQEHLAAYAVCRVDDGVDYAEREDGIENEPMFAGVAEVDEEIAEEQTEPANFDGDVFRREFPAREFGVHAVIIANAASFLLRPGNREAIAHAEMLAV